MTQLREMYSKQDGFTRVLVKPKYKDLPTIIGMHGYNFDEPFNKVLKVLMDMGFGVSNFYRNHLKPRLMSLDEYILKQNEFIGYTINQMPNTENFITLGHSTGGMMAFVCKIPTEHQKKGHKIIHRVGYAPISPTKKHLLGKTILAINGIKEATKEIQYVKNRFKKNIYEHIRTRIEMPLKLACATLSNKSFSAGYEKTCQGLFPTEEVLKSIEDIQCLITNGFVFGRHTSNAIKRAINVIGGIYKCGEYYEKYFDPSERPKCVSLLPTEDKIFQIETSYDFFKKLGISTKLIFGETHNGIIYNPKETAQVILEDIQPFLN